MLQQQDPEKAVTMSDQDQRMLVSPLSGLLTSPWILVP